MPLEMDFAEFQQEVGAMLSPEQREWLARLLHDHVNGPISSVVMHFELIDRMMEQGMDIRDEMALLKASLRSTANHLGEIQMSIRGAT